MPTLQPVVLTDRQATPVNYTLNPKSGPAGGPATVAVADATGAVITEKRLSISTKRSPGRTRVTLRLSIPVIVTETVNGVSTPVVARTGLVDCTFVTTDQHTVAEKNDLVGMFASALGASKVLVNDVIVKGEDIW